MDNREEVREFLTSRRAKITPERAGLPSSSRRRVPGLRRSEVAALADMSVEYYAKLERGNLAGVSPAVLEALARALRLDDAERAHLLHLAQVADGSDALVRPRRRRTRDQWKPHRSLQWTLDAVTAGPAFVRNGRMDVVAANRLARALYSDVYATPGNQANLARFTFLDPASRRFYPDWEQAADVAVAILRTEAGRNPYDKDLHDLVGELSTEGLEMAAEPGLTLTIHTAEPGSSSEEGLRLLATWAATQDADVTRPSRAG
ncbi:helix-turn-helix transcriptional regulator [Streptomyces sp. NPDC004783]|uniref:helix-turn-helix transcriptional regulator n=1 Tax=Streptomyces sp. NPDC004783 TaxID=3154459 RepID=UPI0033AB0E8F